MDQTLVSLLVHVIFSTKNREPLITPEIEPELFAYVGGILKNHDSRLLDAGETADHIHLLLSQSKNVSLSSLMKDIKTAHPGSRQKEEVSRVLIGRCVLDWKIRYSPTEEIHRESERASSKAHFQRRIDRVLGGVRHCL